jgi:signal transduction histidine kinase
VSGDPDVPHATALGPQPRWQPGARVWVTLDWVTAAVCAAIIYTVLFHGTVVYPFPRFVWDAAAWLPPLLALVLSFPVAIRRRDPLLALALVLAGCVITMAFGGIIDRGPILPLALVLFQVAARCTRTVAIAGLAVSLWLLAAQALILHYTGLGPGPAIGSALALIIVWMTGLAVQQRRAYAARLREQVASTAVTEERLRIARELHDVVAHSMTVVAVQAGFGEYVFEQDPGEARAALGAIQRVTREALADMQRMLGVLRQSEAGQDGAGQSRASGPGATPGDAGQDGRLQLAPAPGLADLDRLVATTASAGVRVDVASAAGRPDVPAAIDQSAFRIVQEALTNVVKHSGADRCQVTVGCHEGDLCVEISDPGGQLRAAAAGNGAGQASGTGHGIIGMRERVSLCGGELTAGPLPGQGFRVAARFPLTGAGR